MRRRNATSSLRSMRLTSWPSNRISPAVGRSSRRMQRPVVVLPQPLSPTRPSVSPRLMSKSTPSTAFTSPILRVSTMPSEIGKCMARPRTSSSGRSASRSGAFMRRRPGWTASSALRKHAERCPGSPTAANGGRAAAQLLDGKTAARPEGAAAIEPRQVGRLAVDRIESRPARLVETRHGAAAAPSCRGARRMW